MLHPLLVGLMLDMRSKLAWSGDSTGLGRIAVVSAAADLRVVVLSRSQQLQVLLQLFGAAAAIHFANVVS
jgi:hypothetical protein